MELEIEKAYEAKKYEDGIYKKWEESGAFTPKIDHDKKPFVISMPPPNATGMLHLGHAVMLALQDIMIRHHRMKGDCSLWIPGTDHASIATQNKVEQLIAEKEGKTRHDLGRTDFLKRVNEYVADSQDTIRNQIRKMGSSCDWTRERYTLDKGLTNAVQEVFVRMYKDGLIYRGNRIVNWCPRCSSTLADDEVKYIDRKSQLYWIKYGPFTVATSRPETMLGDTAVAVHPTDKRYKKWIGQTVTIPGPIGDFDVKVVGDKEVDPKFGSGVVKVTPAHSFTDFEIGKRHDLEFKMAIDEEGKMMKNCGKYTGLTTKECRKQIVNDLDEMGLIEKIDDFDHNLSVCYRCDHPIEPLISRQWFIDVDKPIIKENGKKKSIKEKAIEVVKNGQIEIIPSKFNKTYFNWMENLHDWCISRQIWFGHRIPVWYCTECQEPIADKVKPTKCLSCKNQKFKQDPDTLDTWFSSGLWTFSTLGWPEKTEDLSYFHPTSVLETGYDIIFFWVARMIIMTTYTLGEIPFEKVYLHGLIRDKDGQKMSKSKGNGIDPLEMIKKYGTDAVRLSLVIGNTPGNDMRLYEEKIAGYRNFVNKIWNASRFALMNVEKEDLKEEFNASKVKTYADKWILAKLNQLIKDVDKDMEKSHFSEAGTKIYDFIWSQFCDWYLEISKGEYKNPAVLLHVLKTTLKLIHPFTPFVTEKIWESLETKTLLINETWPTVAKQFDYKSEAKTMELIHQAISDIRKVRAELNVEASKKISTTIYAAKHLEAFELKREAIMRLARLDSLTLSEKGPKIPKSKAVFNGDIEIYLPLAELIDPEKESARLKKEIEQKEKFILSLKNKLSNKGFVKNAPAEVIKENKKRLQDEESETEKLKKQLKEL